MSDGSFSRIAVLAVGVRRHMYGFIRQRRAPVSREEAATAVGISRKLAAFHLDKLVDAGLLKAHYARPHGRGGPGAGRPSKLYEPGDVELEVSIPQRHYDIPADILLEALETRKADEDPRVAAERVAYERGLAVGHDAATEDDRSAPILAQQLLRSCGFEPYADDDGIVRLSNCPFHRLAQRSPEIVCGINRAFIEGLLSGVGDAAARAELEPRPNECCVAINRKGEAA